MGSRNSSTDCLNNLIVSSQKHAFLGNDAVGALYPAELRDGSVGPGLGESAREP
jgi:hypothetical protein